VLQHERGSVAERPQAQRLRRRGAPAAERWLGAKAAGAAGVTRRSSSLQRMVRRRWLHAKAHRARRRNVKYAMLARSGRKTVGAPNSLRRNAMKQQKAAARRTRAMPMMPSPKPSKYPLRRWTLCAARTTERVVSQMSDGSTHDAMAKIGKMRSVWFSSAGASALLSSVVTGRVRSRRTSDYASLDNTPFGVGIRQKPGWFFCRRLALVMIFIRLEADSQRVSL
jgi:hypothetical protein